MVSADNYKIDFIILVFLKHLISKKKKKEKQNNERKKEKK